MNLVSFLFHLNHWQIDFVTLGLLLSSTIFTLIPEELLFLTLGLLAQAGHIHILEGIITAKLGLIPADALTVWIGRKMGRDILSRKPFRFLFTEQTLQKALDQMMKSGTALLFFTRFIPFLRAPIYVAAGISGVSLKRSILIDLMAAAIQIPALCLIGYFFGEAARPFITAFTYIALGLALIFALKKASVLVCANESY